MHVLDLPRTSRLLLVLACCLALLAPAGAAPRAGGGEAGGGRTVQVPDDVTLALERQGYR